jgi:hypothetical protein
VQKVVLILKIYQKEKVSEEKKEFATKENKNQTIDLMT